jgi:hypothetical protein
MSHSFGHKRGVLFCWTCGGHSFQNLKLLAGECRGYASVGYGRRILDRLKAGRTPLPKTLWPFRDPVDTSEPPPDLVVFKEPPLDPASPQPSSLTAASQTSPAHAPAPAFAAILQL